MLIFCGILHYNGQKLLHRFIKTTLTLYLLLNFDVALQNCQYMKIILLCL